MNLHEALGLVPGAILMHSLTRRHAILLCALPLPNGRITIQYLDYDAERWDGLDPKQFERSRLIAGTLLYNTETEQNALLCEDSAGPTVRVRYLTDLHTSIEEPLCITREGRLNVPLRLVPPPRNTVARKQP